MLDHAVSSPGSRAPGLCINMGVLCEEKDEEDEKCGHPWVKRGLEHHFLVFSPRGADPCFLGEVVVIWIFRMFAEGR